MRITSKKEQNEKKKGKEIKEKGKDKKMRK